MKIDSTTLLLGVAAVAAVYLITRPKTVAPVYTAPAYNPALNAYQGNTTAQDISAGASALTALGNTLSNFF
jgi:hypothetical protein